MNTDIEQAVEQAMDTAMGDHQFMAGMVTTGIYIIAVILLRYFLTRLVKGKAEILDKEQRKWLNYINNTTFFFLLIGLVFIWAPQIHTFALSLTAFAVAVVLTTKELLMCLTGGILKASTQPFAIGDWITVNNVTGEVVSVNALSVTVEEVDITGETFQFTGRTIQIPNSQFLTHSIENERFIKYYVYKNVSVTIPHSELDSGKLMKKLQEIAGTYYEPFREEAVKYNKKVERKAGVDFPDPAPQFYIQTTDAGHYVFMVRLFVPTQQAASLASHITQDFLAFVNKERKTLFKKTKAA